ncbi:MAG: VWA domain-containing protein, partial [Termitinemataceae bacterium]
IIVFLGRIRTWSCMFKVPLGAPGGAVFKSPVHIQFLVRLASLFEWLTILILLITLAGPVLVQYRTIHLDRGADFLFVIDCSPSMSALDMQGKSRFAVATELVNRFAQLRPADSIGLVAIGAEAALLLPPSTDRRHFKARLDQLSIGELGDGTAIGMGLAIAALHLRSSEASKKVVVLLTDGENNAGAVHPVTAARMLKELDVLLWVIGIGTSGVVPLDYVDPLTGQRKTGTFESHYNPDELRTVAREGGGTFLVADSTETLLQAFTQMNTASLVFGRSHTYRETVPIGSALLAIAAFCMTLSRFIKHLILGALV